MLLMRAGGPVTKPRRIPDDRIFENESNRRTRPARHHLNLYQREAAQTIDIHREIARDAILIELAENERIFELQRRKLEDNSEGHPRE